jgi:hypothetical protein
MKSLKSLSLAAMAAITLASSPILAQSTNTAAAGPQLYERNVDGSYSPVTLATNAAGMPFLSGPFVDIINTLGTATNWGVATFGIYEPASNGHKAAAGAGAVFLYNINTYMAAGIGIDWMNNQVTMPSGQFQLQAPLHLGGTNGVTVTPFAFTGVATPVSGMGSDNGTVVGLFGAGLDVKIYKGFGAFYAIEQRTGQPAPWNLFGVRWSARF